MAKPDTYMPTLALLTTEISTTMLNITITNSSILSTMPPEKVKHSPELEKVIISFVTIIMITISVVGNLFVIISVILNKRLRSNTGILLANLACADLGQGVLAMPLRLVEVLNDGFTPLVPCAVSIPLSMLFGGGSNICLALVSIDRFIAWNFGYKKTNNLKRLSIVVVSLWVGVIILSLLPTFGWGKIAAADTLTNVCLFGSFLTKEYILLNFSIVVFLVWGILVFTNFFLIYGLLKVYFQIGKVSPEKSNEETLERCSEGGIELKEEKKRSDASEDIEEVETIERKDGALEDGKPPENEGTSHRQQEIMCKKFHKNGSFLHRSTKGNSEKKHEFCSNPANNHKKEIIRQVDDKQLRMKRSIHKIGEETPLKLQRPNKALRTGNIVNCADTQKKDNLAKRERKATVMVVVIVCLFIFLTAPIITIDLLSLWCHTCPTPPRILVLLAICMIYANACVNPIIYAGLNSEYRKTFMRILIRIRDSFRS